MKSNGNIKAYMYVVQCVWFLLIRYNILRIYSQTITSHHITSCLLRLDRPDGLLPISTSVTCTSRPTSDSSWRQFQSELFPDNLWNFETVHCWQHQLAVARGSDLRNRCTLARKIYKIPEFCMIFARKMPEFYIIIARKIFSRILGGTCPPPVHPSPTPKLELHRDYVYMFKLNMHAMKKLQLQGTKSPRPISGLCRLQTLEFSIPSATSPLSLNFVGYVPDVVLYYWTLSL